MIDARAYIRVSTKGSKDRGTYKSQVSALREYARKEKINLVKIYYDLAVTGTMKLEERPEGAKLLAEIRPGEKVLAVHFDRLTREDNREDWFRVFELLKAIKVPFDPVEGSEIDPTDENADISWLLEGKKARHEYERLVKRFNRGRKDAKKLRGHYAEGGIPFGVYYHNVRTDDLGNVIPVKKYKKHPDEFEVLKRFFEMVKKGYALEAIADQFNTEGIPTKYGKKWAGTTLNQILKNDFYFTGILIHKRETVYDKDGTKRVVKLAEKDWIRIDTGIRLFSRAEVEAVRKARSLHPSTRKKRTRANEAKYPPGYKVLQGHLYCECGRVMTPHTSGYDYRCKRKGCRKDGLKIRETDRQVWKSFENDLTDPEALYDALKAENFISGINIKEARKRVKVAEGKLKLIAESKDRFTVNYGRQRITEKAYEAEMAKLEKEESYWKHEKARAENTTYDTDVMELAARSAAEYMANKIGVVKALKEVKDSLATADTEIKLEFYPKLIEILKDFSVDLENYQKPESIEDVKNMTFEIKRNILKDASLNGVKVVSYKDGSIFIHGLLTSEFSVQTTFG